MASIALNLPAAAPALQNGLQSSNQNRAANPAAAPRAPDGKGEAPAAATTEPSLAALRLATHEVEQAVRARTSSLSFSIDQSSGKTIVRITDQETGAVLRQIPSEEMLSLAKAVNQMQGLLLSQTA